MPGVVRNGDPLSGGDIAANGSLDVFAATETSVPTFNVVRKTDETEGVGDPDESPCPFDIASPDVFVNGVPVVRVGDVATLGESVTDGSHTVFANSASGGGALIDNNAPVINGKVTGHPISQTGMQDTPPPEMVKEVVTTVHRTYTIYNYSNADVPAYEHDEEVTGSPTPPPGTVINPSNSTPKQTDPTPAPTNPPPVHDCADVEALPDTFNWFLQTPTATWLAAHAPAMNYSANSFDEFKDWASSFQLSPRFTVWSLSGATAISKYKFTNTVIQDSGISQKDTLRNLCYLSNTILETLFTQFASIHPLITSCFRSKVGTSQHNKGQAADVQYLVFHSQGNTGQLYFNQAQTLRDTYNFDQLILEWFGRNPWTHISVNPAGHRHQVLTQVGTNSYQPGLTRLS